MNDTLNKKCPYCKELIKKDAVFCTKCNNFLNWRRYLNFGNTFLALLVALISVLSFAIPAIRNSLTPDNSNLHLNYLFVYSGNIVMIVSNSGTKPGHIANGLISYSNGLQKKNIGMQVVGVAAGENYIAQGSSKEIQLFIDNDGRREIQNDINNLNKLGEIVLLINVINFKGTKATYQFKLEKTDFAKLNEGG